MAHRSRRRTVYLLTVVGLLAVLTGFTVANVALLNNNQAAQGQFTKNSGSVPGIADRAISYVNVPAPAPAVASTTKTALTVLVMGGAGHISRYCAATCTAGNWSEEFQYTITAQAAAEGFQVTINAVAGSHALATTLYFSIPATAGGRTNTILDVYVDLVAASANAAGTAALQQCSSSTTCP